MSKYLQIGLAAAISAVPLAGCGGDSPDRGPVKGGPEVPWQLPRSPDPGVRDALRGLFDGFSTRFAAEQELVHRCMAAKGFRYVKLTAPATDAHPTMGKDDYGIGVAAAKRHGYKTQERIGGPQNDPGAADLKLLSEADRKRWGEAFYGPDDVKRIRVTLPDGKQIETSPVGCLSEARIKIFGSLEQMLKGENFAANLPIEARRRAGADPAMKTLNSTWSACMSGKGHPALPDPAAARSQAATRYKSASADQAFRAEIKLAVADAECELKNNYAAQRRRLEDLYYTAGMRRYEADITAIREMNQAALARAKKILTS
ncbi:hypothetical protein DPM19_19305 [Actinomadura craniellae]|uniref:Uncharacterized protein n=2 Tax=Actinomadura craniellae TaxID=2231787 RepID=A0A365H3X9_9ACTN|nr:hypothetical protein DPM19_19305 [Actinomadura craniellae]